jgi:hypothetical protein
MSEWILNAAQYRERDHHVRLPADRCDANPCQRQIVLLCSEALQDSSVFVAFDQDHGFRKEGFWEVLEADLFPPAPDGVLLDVPVEPLTDRIETCGRDPRGRTDAVLAAHCGDPSYFVEEARLHEVRAVGCVGHLDRLFWIGRDHAQDRGKRPGLGGMLEEFGLLDREEHLTGCLGGPRST